MGFHTNNDGRNFSSTLYDGDCGEELLKAFLEKKNFKVIDVRTNPEYQQKDIDFIISGDNVHFYTMEVKSDGKMCKTGNIFVEECMKRQIGDRKGWLYYCEADILCFIDIVNYYFYFIDWKKLKNKILVGFWKRITFNNVIDKCTGLGYIIPVKELFDNKLIITYGKIYFK